MEMEGIGRSKPKGAIPGYSGHVPFMRNNLIGRSFTPATLRSAAFARHLHHNDYASALQIAVDSRPQGRDFLYAQTTKFGGEDGSEPIPVIPRVSKRLPPPEMQKSTGHLDARHLKYVIGSNEECIPKVPKSTSLPELPYKDRSIQIHKEYEPMDKSLNDIKTIVGYAGHKHGAHHIFSRSYGSTERELLKDHQTPDKPTVHDLLYFKDPRPTGQILVEKPKIPGYQGYIPAKDNHIYGKTAGKSSELAATAEMALKTGCNPGAMPELVDKRPQQACVDLYAQAQEQYHMERKIPLHIRVDKGRVDVKYHEKSIDHRVREKVEPDIREVMQNRHSVYGYTGHVHALQHLYGKSYGKITRDLHGKPANPETSEHYLEFTDSRPMADQTGELLIS